MRTTILAAAAATLLFGQISTVQAATLPEISDTYEGTYTATAHADTDDGHAVWLPDLAGVFGDTDWKFADGSGLLSYPTAGGNAVLTGTVVNDDGASAFELSLELAYLSKGDRTPKCELGGYCGSLQYADEQLGFEYFTFLAATLTGVDTLAGLVIDMVMAPTNGSYPFQLGYSADNKNAGEFGASTWFNYVISTNTYGVGGIQVGATGHGDINIQLAPVPLPAGIVLLLGGLGALGVTRARRKHA